MAFPGFQDHPSPPDQQENISYVKEAFHLQYNWIALAGAGAFALISGSFLPIILAGGLELMYLAIVPQNWRVPPMVCSWETSPQRKEPQQKTGQMPRDVTPRKH